MAETTSTGKDETASTHAEERTLVVPTTRPSGGWRQDISYISHDENLSFRPLIIAKEEGDGSPDDDFEEYCDLMEDESSWDSAGIGSMDKVQARSWFNQANDDQTKLGLFITNPDGKDKLVGEVGAYRLEKKWPEYYIVLRSDKWEDGRPKYQNTGYGTKLLSAFLEIWWSLEREAVFQRCSVDI